MNELCQQLNEELDEADESLFPTASVIKVECVKPPCLDNSKPSQLDAIQAWAAKLQEDFDRLQFSPASTKNGEKGEVST